VGLDDIYLDVQPHPDNLVSGTLASASSQSSSTTPVYCQNTIGQIIANLRYFRMRSLPLQPQLRYAAQQPLRQKFYGAQQTICHAAISVLRLSFLLAWFLKLHIIFS
jgi:hypothetical protein